MSSAAAHIDWQEVRDTLDRRLAASRASFADDAARAAAIMRERSLLLARPPVVHERRSTPFLVFSCGGVRFGLPITALREVVAAAAIARVPGAAASVTGVMTWRGAFVTVFDVPCCLGASQASASPPPYAAVLRAAAPPLALGFDRAEGIGRFDVGALQPADQWQSATPELFSGATADAVALFDAARLTERLRADLRAA